MTKEELRQQREKLFNNDFTIKEPNAEEIIAFCRELTNITGIQACNVFGYTNELLPKLYNSCINK